MKNNNQYFYRYVMSACYASILVATFILPDGFVSLPAYIRCFDDLTPECIDTLRYTTKGLSFGLVYGIYNQLTHQIYVGSTINPVIRFYDHLISGLNSNVYLQSAIAKYGLESFMVVIFEVLGKNNSSTKEDLLNLEQGYLDHFPTEQKYNFATVAGGGGRPMSIAERQAVSERMLGLNVGRAPINKGVKLTVAAKAALAKVNAHRRHAVYIYDDMFNLVAMYPSISQAVKIEKTQKNIFIKHFKMGTL